MTSVRKGIILIENIKSQQLINYQIIVELPMKCEGQEIYVKVEIQICTMTMNFWSTAEIKINYKTKVH